MKRLKTGKILLHHRGQLVPRGWGLDGGRGKRGRRKKKENGNSDAERTRSFSTQDVGSRVKQRYEREKEKKRKGGNSGAQPCVKNTGSRDSRQAGRREESARGGVWETANAGVIYHVEKKVG